MGSNPDSNPRSTSRYTPVNSDRVPQPEPRRDTDPESSSRREGWPQEGREEQRQEREKQWFEPYANYPERRDLAPEPELERELELERERERERERELELERAVRRERQQEKNDRKREISDSNIKQKRREWYLKNKEKKIREKELEWEKSIGKEPENNPDADTQPATISREDRIKANNKRKWQAIKNNPDRLEQVRRYNRERDWRIKEAKQKEKAKKAPETKE